MLSCRCTDQKLFHILRVLIATQKQNSLVSIVYQDFVVQCVETETGVDFTEKDILHHNHIIFKGHFLENESPLNVWVILRDVLSDVSILKTEIYIGSLSLVSMRNLRYVFLELAGIF